jgi:uroporphyrinogen decarboxylase
LRAQIAAGAQALQLFDSWVGALSPDDFRTYVLPAVRRIFAELADLPVPKIYFPGVASGELLPCLTELEADVIGLDWRVSIPEARRRIGPRFAVQGNLDPMVLTAPMPVIEQRARELIDAGLERPGYIFNLGHGLFPEASLDKVRALTAFVHEYSRSVLSQRRNGRTGRNAERKEEMVSE